MIRHAHESARASPGELDLQLVLVVPELDLDLQVDLVGHTHGDPTTRAIELHGVVASKGVGQGVELGRGLLATEMPGLSDLEQVHVVSSGACVRSLLPEPYCRRTRPNGEPPGKRCAVCRNASAAGASGRADKEP